MNARIDPRHRESTLDLIRANDQPLGALVDELRAILDGIIAFEKSSKAQLRELHKAYETSSRNLLHYIAMRHSTMPVLQQQLASLGLSSLGRSESHVIASITAVLRMLCSVLRRPVLIEGASERQVSYRDGYARLDAHTEALLGPRPPRRRVRIMVTPPGEAADDPALVHELVRGGMDCARVNCAHDGPEVWQRMIDNVRAAERQARRRCRILMDLAGPKIRTGPLPPGPQVVKLRPQRDALGAVQKPAVAFLCPEADASGSPPGATAVPVDPSWLRSLRAGTEIAFTDARGRRRRMQVVGRHANGRLAAVRETAYLVPSTVLRVVRNGRPAAAGCPVGPLPAADGSLLLRTGDPFIITADETLGAVAQVDKDGNITAPARIACMLPSVAADVRPGERVWLDDGKIGGVIESTDGRQMRVRITHARAQGSRLRADKGINLPDTSLSVSGLTDKDIADLAFIGRRADMVALSFLRSPADIRALRKHLRRLGCVNLGVVLKIETRQAFQRLPSLLLAAMSSYPVGVMIARGDLAVEIGFDNLAEAQEEILWLCEAAHVPVIWATQVLETLAKQGQPSRAEISDAAMSVRAECVMLNKGPYIRQALQMLETILRRMERRRLKKSDSMNLPTDFRIELTKEPAHEDKGEKTALPGAARSG